ncbi:HEPACAM family member 2-like isoform X1 [Paralichthys olivaceus]|uniref:HEPACAM family member 2-like isoform X1 n=1 Tax=Paralichthys olivaceus TaxID=8255 RepID=UPI003750E276
MEAVVALLVMLLGVSHGVEIICDVQQEGGAQCYGALGGTVILKMKDRSPARFEIRKNHRAIFRWANNNVSLNTIENRSLFTPSAGTFRINNLIKSDSDEYKLKISDSGGMTLLDQTLRLSIQAPVSSVQLVSKCLSQGEMRVSCVSEGGDSLQYRWTLNGRTLTEDKLLSGTHETDNITLKQDVSGSLGCSVKNHVSDRETVEIISTCGFIFIDCIDSNETHISQWVFAANNTLCVDPTTKAPDTTVGKKTDFTVSLKPTINITSSNHTVTSFSREDSWVINPSLICGVQTAVAALLFIGIAAYFAWRKNKSQRAEGSAIPRAREYPETSVEMV